MYKLIFMPTLSNLQKDWAAKLNNELPGFEIVISNDEEEAMNEIKDSDAAFGYVSNKLLKRATKLRWIQAHHAAPPPGFYYEELTQSPVTVTNFRGVYNDHISAHIMMYVLGLSRGITGYFRAQNERSYDVNANDQPFVFLPDSTAIIFGIGGIGTETSKHCKSFGMNVIGIDPRVSQAPDTVDRLVTPDDYQKVIGKADFVIVTMPLTPENEFFFNSEVFSMMKSSAYFINIGRGKTTNLNDLVMAIKSNEIAGAGLDVYDTEPLPKDHELWSLQNVILTPHVAAKEDGPGGDVNERKFKVLLENAQRFEKGEQLLNIVDKNLWF
ncbi:MAG: Phosphoglycerate dehydrogenase [Chloroflexi bacterium]|nr:MAG: Phosphoglycerate dehydrogenase [Chloroflexota bacterium]